MSVPVIRQRHPSRSFGAAQASRAITRTVFSVPRCISPLSVTAADCPPGPGEHHSAGAGVVQGEVCQEGDTALHLPGMGPAASRKGTAGSHIECHPEPF